MQMQRCSGQQCVTDALLRTAQLKMHDNQPEQPHTASVGMYPQGVSIEVNFSQVSGPTKQQLCRAFVSKLHLPSSAT